MTKPSISRSRPSAAAESSSGKRRPSNNDDSSFPSLYNPEDTTNTNSTKPANQTKNQRAPLKKNSNNRSHNRRKGSTSSEESSGSIEFDQEDSDDDNDGDDAEEDDAEEDEPSVFAPSYGNRLKRRRKAGLSSSPSQLRKEKRVKIKQSELESDDEGSIGSACSVSSVSSISIDGSVSGDSDAEYEGVDYVSDGDDEDVEKLEEELILDEFERGPASTVVPGPRGLGDEWSGFDDLENRPLYSAGSFFENDILVQTTAPELAVDANDATAEEVETPMPRRVHFADSGDSSDSEKTSEDELMSDFLLQENLDPDLRRMIENDSDAPKHLRNRNDLFDTNEYYELPGNIYHVESSSEVGSSSGYESDGGETTDEEDYPPPATITHPRSILRRDSSASVTADEEEENEQARPLARRGPLRGTFIADPHKPVAVVAPNGKQLILIPPYASYRHDWLESVTNSMANTAANSPGGNNTAEDSDTDALVSPSRLDFSPMLSSAANLMMTAVVGNDIGGQMTGPPEAFYPNEEYIFEGFEDDEDDEDSEAALNVDDFINFGDDSSDGETEKTDVDEIGSPVAASNLNVDITPTPNRIDATSQSNSAERLLNHLDRGIVTAFRRNHTRYQTLIRLPQHREFMPANSPSRPASAFRRSKLTETRTPPRKRKASNYLGGEAVRRKLLDSHRRNSTLA